MKLLKRNPEKSMTAWYFLLAVLMLYAVMLIINREKTFMALTFSLNIFKNILFVLIVIIAIMALTNKYISPKKVATHLGKSSGVKRWFIAILGGIISTGPVYMWYPLLRDLKDKGVNYGFIACFLYNRAVKIPLLPMLILYFGMSFTLVLTVVMILASILQGIIIEKIEEARLL